MLRAVTGAFAWMTVLPMPPQAAPTREDARRIIAAVPVTGVLVGTLVAAIAWGACAAGLAPLLAGALAGVEMALVDCGIPVALGSGVGAALAHWRVDA